ncbi:MAG: CooT family nickel-binding protein [Proteobacteria bacterium]|nr:CooT family nickel-binding protein [Pseudomonadota bacterium]MBU1740516.1 CooT family nickel-binding protein [Pseudomonadota bacterium]
MCEANAYLYEDGQETVVMEGVDLVEPEGDKIRLVSIFGEQRVVQGRIKSMSLVNHKIVLEAE